MDRIYSVDEVVAALDALHGRTLQIAGVLHLEFEANSLNHFPSCERLSDDASRLWVDSLPDRLAAGSGRSLRTFNGRRVVATAIVNKEEKGHLSLWPGGVLIQNVVKYDPTAVT